jgi:hypothetical protein
VLCVVWIPAWQADTTHHATDGSLKEIDRRLNCDSNVFGQGTHELPASQEFDS